MSLLSGFFSLGQDVNKVKPRSIETNEGIVSDLLPELELDMSDDDLVSLKNKWEKKWQDGSRDLLKKQEENEKYWVGKQFSNVSYSDGRRPLTDNLLFEAQETFLPLATRQNPEPVVSADNTLKGKAVAMKIEKTIVTLTDLLRLRLKMKQILRHWSLYFLGALKVGWSQEENEISIMVIRPQRLILDPDATIEESQYSGEYIGEYRKDKAEDLATRFPKKAALITQMVDSKMGTEVQYIEWWTDKYVFWTLKNEVLAKYRNPHWNYETTEEKTDEFGTQTEEAVPGLNHFAHAQKPYVFLSVFNLGLHPWDDTSLISQNLSLQDLINKRLAQIDKNADATNGGMVVSGESFTKEQASQVSDTLRRGGTILVPTGDVNRAVRRDAAPALPPFVYQSLTDYRNELRNIFGIRGSTPQGTTQEQTVRGKIIVKGQDIDRVALIVDYVEQFVDLTYNWFTQLIYVYYDQNHFASIVGEERAQEYVSLRQEDLNRKLLVSVKEGSLIPKDSLTQRNEAVDLWTAGALDPKTLFEQLDFPNPQESAKQLYLWKTNPAALFPGLEQPVVPQPVPAPRQVTPTPAPVEQPQSTPDFMSALNLPPL